MAENEYTITYHIGTLTAKQQDEKTLLLLDEDGETIYEITMPYMTDANGEISEGISLTLLQSANIQYAYTDSANPGVNHHNFDLMPVGRYSSSCIYTSYLKFTGMPTRPAAEPLTAIMTPTAPAIPEKATPKPTC